MSFTMIPVLARFLREDTPCAGEAEFELSQPLRDVSTGTIVSGVRTVVFDAEGYLGAPAGVEIEALDDATTLPAPDPGTGLPTVYWRVRLKIQGDRMREYVLYVYAADVAGVQLATRLDGVASRPLYPYVLLPVYAAHVAETIADGAHGGLAALNIPALSDDAPVADTTPADPGTGDEAARSDHAHPLSAAYVPASAVGSANGVASLDSAGLLPTAQLPPLAITDTTVVASQAAMLALVAQKGDVAVRSDLNQNFILAGTDPTILVNWVLLLTPTDTVLSVNGLTGAITLDDSNISGQDPTAGNALHTLRVILSNLWAAISGNTTNIATNTTNIANLRFYDIAGGTADGTKPGASAAILRFEAVRAFTLPAGWATSKATAGTAATASTVLTIAKNGSSIGTITYASSGTTGTFSGGGGGSFVAGDILTVTAPSSQDSTLAGVSITLAGTV